MPLIEKPSANNSADVSVSPPAMIFGRMLTSGRAAYQNIAGTAHKVMQVEVEVRKGELLTWPTNPPFSPSMTVSGTPPGGVGNGITHNDTHSNSFWCTNLLMGVDCGDPQDDFSTVLVKAVFAPPALNQTELAIFKPKRVSTAPATCINGYLVSAAVEESAPMTDGNPSPRGNPSGESGKPAPGVPTLTAPRSVEPSAHSANAVREAANPPAESCAIGCAVAGAMADSVCLETPLMELFGPVTVARAPASIMQLCFKTTETSLVQIQIAARLALVPLDGPTPSCTGPCDLKVRTAISVNGTHHAPSHRVTTFNGTDGCFQVDTWFVIQVWPDEECRLSWELVEMLGDAPGSVVRVHDGIVFVEAHS